MRTRRAVRRVEVAESVEKGYSSDEQPSTDDGDMETGWVHKRKVSAMRKRQKRNPSYVIGEEMIQPNYQNYRLVWQNAGESAEEPSSEPLLYHKPPSPAPALPEVRTTAQEETSEVPVASSTRSSDRLSEFDCPSEPSVHELVPVLKTPAAEEHLAAPTRRVVRFLEAQPRERRPVPKAPAPAALPTPVIEAKGSVTEAPAPAALPTPVMEAKGLVTEAPAPPALPPTTIEEKGSLIEAWRLNTQAAHPIAPQPVATYVPTFIRQLLPIVQFLTIPPDPVVFSGNFLGEFLGGREFIPDMCFNRTPAPNMPEAWAYMTRAEQPFMPPAPGHHGAYLRLLSGAIYMPPLTDPWAPLPIFVADKPGRHVYLGHYVQPRSPDFLSYSETEDHVPVTVRRHIADRFGGPIRPDWVSRALKMQSFAQQRPAVSFPLTEESRLMLERHDREAEEMVAGMDGNGIMQAMENADWGCTPSLRLSWVYWRCEKWDRAFYDELVAGKRLYDGYQRVLKESFPGFP